MLFLGLGLTGGVAVQAEDEDSEEAVEVAQAFYDGYMKALNSSSDTVVYVKKSKLVTPAFKKAYAKFMEEPDSDPIICGQDYPDKGFTAGKPIVKGTRARVTMNSRDKSFPVTFNVVLVNGEEGWLLAETQDLKPGE